MCILKAVLKVLKPDKSQGKMAEGHFVLDKVPTHQRANLTNNEHIYRFQEHQFLTKSVNGYLLNLFLFWTKIAE